MPWISSETKAILAKTLDEAIPIYDICPCNDIVTLAFQPKSILMQTSDYGAINGDIVDYGQYLGRNFLAEHSNLKSCQHVPVTSIHVVVNLWDIERIMQTSKVLIYHAKVIRHQTPITIETRGIQTGILDLAIEKCDLEKLRFGEVFSGGFSGWTHVTRAIAPSIADLEHAWAIEKDYIAVNTYVDTHPGSIPIRSSKEAFEHSKYNVGCEHDTCRVFQSDVQDAWYMSHLRAKETAVVAWSPPCQPWSAAHTSQGFNKTDGLTWIQALVVISHMRPVIFLLEEVAQFGKHQQTELIVKLIYWAGYDIVYTQMMNLRDVLPQNRERVVIVAVDRFAEIPLNDHKWESWPPMPAFNIRSSRVICALDQQNMDHLIPNQEVMSIYMDKMMMPRKGEMRFESTSEHTIREYRIKHMDDPCFSCIMANYRKTHDLPQHILEQGGLYGSFINDGCNVRFLANAEVYLLMGALHEGVFPLCEFATTHMLGNAISTPHARIAILNGLKIIKGDLPKTIQEIFIDIMALRLKSDAISIISSEAGIVIRNFSEIRQVVEPTQSFPSFVTVTIQTPTTSIRFYVRSGLKIYSVIMKLMGPSTPKEIWIVLPKGVKLPLLRTDATEQHPMVLWANIPSILSIMDENLRSTKEPFIITLSGMGPVIVNRNEGQLVYQILNMMKDFFPEGITDNAQIVDGFGIPLDLQRDCPDMIFCQNKPEQEICNDDIMNFVKFKVVQDHLSLSANWKTVFRVIKLFNKLGIDETLKSLGWSLQLIPHTASRSHCVEIVIAKQPDSLSVPLKQMQMCIISRVVVTFLPKSLPDHERKQHVCFKLWDSWIWDGFLPADERCGVFTETWSWLSDVFAYPSEIRIVAKGRNVSPETSFQEIVKPHESIRLHAIFQLSGGGNKTDALIEAKNQIAVIMLNNGADLAETTQMIDTMSKTCGLQTFKNIVAMKDDKQKIEALKQLSNSMHFKFPQFPKSQKGMQTKTKEWANKKNLQPVQQISANHLELIPDVFRNEDKTIPLVKTSMTTAMSGIILLDYETAIPWVRDHTVVSSDECGIIVLGHKCPSNDPKRCCRIQIPVKTSISQTAIVAACLHNVGQKQISLHKDDSISQIDVKAGTVVAITVFRDEIQTDDWNFVTLHPVKFALQSLGFDEESFFLGPPWGRSWISQGSKCQPSMASSVQFHVRIEDTKVESYMRNSGSNGVYITPKTPNNIADNKYAIIWIDKTPIELSQILVNYPQHLGLVRVTKEKTSTSKTSRGVRCKRSDFAVLFQKIKPGDSIPDITPILCMYKIQPIPLGAKFDDITRWMKSHAWDGRPIKSLNEKTWLVGSSTEMDTDFLMWNNQSILIKPIKSKAQSPISPIVAGSLPPKQTQGQGQTVTGISDPWTLNDPWSRFVPSTSSSAMNAKTAAPPAANQARCVDAPTEARFQQQSEKVSQLEEAVKEMQSKFDKRDKKSSEFESKVEAEFKMVRSEVATQIGNMSQSFQETMEKALEKQDKQMNNSFAELKQLIRLSSQPNPAKKAKVQPNMRDNDDDEQPEL